MTNENDHVSKRGALKVGGMQTVSSTAPPAMAAEEDIVADLDEPPELRRSPRPAPLTLQRVSTASFTKSKPRCDRQQSLLTSALQASSNASSPVDEYSDKSPVRGMSTVSTWSNTSVTTADLTSDGGLTSPVSRTSTPSPPPPPARFHSVMPLLKKPLEQHVSVVTHDGEHLERLQKSPVPPPSNFRAQPASEQNVEAVLGRKRCIMFACGKKEEKKPATEPAQPAEPPKRACTIKFACPAKPSTDAPSQPAKPRARMVSPAPLARRIASSPNPSPKVHRDSDSTVRNNSPVSMRKAPEFKGARRMSLNADLARCEAYRFHEFASSEEEVDTWTQESTCHRSRLTVSDTLKVENGLRKLGQEVEEEALAEEDDEDDVVDMDDDDDDQEDPEDSDAYSDATDEGFQSDDEEGFAVSDNESDAGSDFAWWVPGASTAATSVEHLHQLRITPTRTVSESSIGSLESIKGFQHTEKLSSKRRKSRPVNIRIPTPELPDSTDFVCGTLDEDKPLEQAFLSTLERRRAAKHKVTPQDIDPTFPTSDPELPDDEEDEVSEAENVVSESDNHFMLHGRMDQIDGDARGRRAGTETIKKRSPVQSPRRLRSPPPSKRTMHRSPPPRKLFGHSPRRHHSPPPMRLRSPPPTRRGSVNPLAVRQRSDIAIRFAGLAERPALIMSASVPRTPITPGPNPLEYNDEEPGPNDMPVRRAIDIQVGLEKKRQRRKDQLYRKQHRKQAAKEKRPPPPGRGAERMREMGLAAHAHKGKTVAFNPFYTPSSPDTTDMHVLSV
jgi:hypothetical protein